jgi:hypothetical protein
MQLDCGAKKSSFDSHEIDDIESGFAFSYHFHKDKEIRQNSWILKDHAPTEMRVPRRSTLRTIG